MSIAYLIRWTGALLAGAVALALSALALRTFLRQVHSGFYPGPTIIALCATTAAILLWGLAFRGHRPESRARLRLIFVFGLIGGTVGFAAGLLIPLAAGATLFGAIQLGMYFIAGSIAFLLGTLSGWLYLRFRRRPL